MNRIKLLKEQRAAKLTELNALRTGAEKRQFTAEEGTKFDALETEVRNFNADISREERFDAENPTAPVEAAKQDADERVGLSDKEIRKYSLTRAINLLAEGRALDGLEGEASVAESKRVGRDAAGFFVPMEIMSRGRGHRAEKRVNQVGVASDGGYTVGVDNSYENMVGLLRNSSLVMGMGARVLTGLKNDVAIPRVLTGAVAYWVSEQGGITDSSATFGQIGMKPRRLGASVPYSRQFLAQSGLSVDQFIQDDILGAFGVELDRVAINGAGATEPLGILNLAAGDRATSVSFGGAATWAKVISFETNVATANALGMPGSKYNYLTTPATKGVWKAAAKVTNQAVFLWEAGDIVNGYSAGATNQFPTSGTLNQVVFGDFSQVVYGEWSGVDLTVDPYSLAKTGKVQVTIQKFVDMVIRQGKAFAISSDSGAQ